MTRLTRLTGSNGDCSLAAFAGSIQAASVLGKTARFQRLGFLFFVTQAVGLGSYRARLWRFGRNLIAHLVHGQDYHDEGRKLSAVHVRIGGREGAYFSCNRVSRVVRRGSGMGRVMM